MIKNAKTESEEEIYYHEEEELVLSPAVLTATYSNFSKNEVVSNQPVYSEGRIQLGDLIRGFSQEPQLTVKLTLELLTYDDLDEPLKVQVLTMSELDPGLVESVIEASCQQDDGLTEWSDGVVDLECPLDATLVKSVDAFKRSLLVIELPDSAYYSNAVLAQFTDVRLDFIGSVLLGKNYHADFDLSFGSCYASPSHAELYQDNIDDFNGDDNLSDWDCTQISSRLILELN